MMGLIFDEVLDGREGESLEGNIERLEGRGDGCCGDANCEEGARGDPLPPGAGHRVARKVRRRVRCRANISFFSSSSAWS